LRAASVLSREEEPSAGVLVKRGLVNVAPPLEFRQVNPWRISHKNPTQPGTGVCPALVDWKNSEVISRRLAIRDDLNLDVVKDDPIVGLAGGARRAKDIAIRDKCDRIESGDRIG